MKPILAIGPHIFEILPLSLQKLTERTVANWPMIGRFGQAGARQFTGFGEDTFEISGLYYDEEFGGHQEYMALKATQRRGLPIDLLGAAASGAAANIFGAAVILEVGNAHSFIGAGGVGRKAEFSVKLGAFGGEAGGGLF